VPDTENRTDPNPSQDGDKPQPESHDRMTTLVLELRPGDLLIVNGAPLRFRNRARVELTNRARFLFGKQVLTAETATTPARKIYLALQTAYIGQDEERAGVLAEARRRVADYGGPAAPESSRLLLRQALEAAEAEDHYQALKLVRRVIRQEEGETPAAP
jgi:flagellar protein FlbT